MTSRPAQRPKAAAPTITAPLDREPPRSARGARTRAKLVAAARTVFERDGYLDSRVVDISTEANTATGSFYTYFDSKEEIFAAVLAELQEDMLHQHIHEVVGTDDPAAMIEASHRAYLVLYRRNAKLMRLLEQVSTIDDSVRDMRRDRQNAFAERNAHTIRSLQARGLADPTLDPLLTATALSAMVSRVAYYTYVYGDEWDLDQLVAELTLIWVNALGIPKSAPNPAKAAAKAAAKAKAKAKAPAKIKTKATRKPA